MQESIVFKRESMSERVCHDVNDRYEHLTKVGAGTYGYLSCLFFQQLFLRKIKSNILLIDFFSEVTKARCRLDPNQLVALKKIKDERETEGVSFIFYSIIVLLY